MKSHYKMNTNTIKAILVIFVIVDHNNFSRLIFSDWLAGFSFHVVGFLALIFMKTKQEKFTFNNVVLNYGVRYYYPYFIFVIGLWLVIRIFYQEINFNELEKLLLSLYSADYRLLKETTHLYLLWFLPALLSLILLMLMFMNFTKKYKVFFVFMCMFFHIGASELLKKYSIYIPLNLLVALYVFPLALIIVAINNYLLNNFNRVICLCTVFLSFFMVKTIQIEWGLKQEIGFLLVDTYKTWPALLINDLESIVGAVLIFQIARFKCGDFLDVIGKNSLQIYLIHIFVAQPIYLLVQPFTQVINPLWLLILTAGVTIYLSYLISTLIMNNKFIKRFTFPKNIYELSGLKRDEKHS